VLARRTSEIGTRLAAVVAAEAAREHSGAPLVLALTWLDHRTAPVATSAGAEGRG
jgi:hypothetical protein